jgi:hypothetical protein
MVLLFFPRHCEAAGMFIHLHLHLTASRFLDSI